MTVCRRCKAPIMWVESPAGRPMPLDPEPSASGTIRLSIRIGDAPARPTFQVGTVLVRADLESARATGWPLYVSHFATCPYADEFRKKKGGVSEAVPTPDGDDFDAATQAWIDEKHPAPIPPPSEAAIAGAAEAIAEARARAEATDETAALFRIESEPAGGSAAIDA